MTGLEDIHFRPPQRTDAQAVADLYTRSDASFGGTYTQTKDEILTYWTELDPATDAWLAVTANEQVAGYEEVVFMAESKTFTIDGVVAPDCTGRGIGTHLLGLAESRVRNIAAEQDLTAPEVYATINSRDEAAVDMFKSRGYTWYKADAVMEIDMAEAPAPPQWPDGVTVRTFIPGQDDRAVFEVVDTAFRAIRGYAERAAGFDRWRQLMVEREGFDPTLWFLAVEDEEVIGVCLCPHDRPTGWVRQLAVLPEHQGRGLGQSLLRHTFGEWFRRGQRQVGLAVQLDNANARRVYEKAGMRLASQYDTYRANLG